MARTIASLLLALTLCIHADEPPASGAIAGLVRFTGAVPPDQKIITSDGMVLVHNDLVVDAKTKGLRHVAVFLQDAPAKTPALKDKPMVIDQRDMLFLPRVVVVRQGQTVRFENNDLSNHAVMATSTKTENCFNVVTPQGQPYSHVFTAHKAPVQIGCPIHAWMRAWVYVLPHPYGAVTDAQGKFQIDGVPPGKHQLVLAHPDTGLREIHVVEVTAGKTTRVAIEWKKAAK
jgi:plastocyanin